MSPLMRARSALTGRGEGAGVMGGFLFELKVAGPSMLGIGCPDRHPLPLIHTPPSPKTHRLRRAESRESGFVPCPIPAIAEAGWRLGRVDLSHSANIRIGARCVIRKTFLPRSSGKMCSLGLDENVSENEW